MRVNGHECCIGRVQHLYGEVERAGLTKNRDQGVEPEQKTDIGRVDIQKMSSGNSHRLLTKIKTHLNELMRHGGDSYTVHGVSTISNEMSASCHYPKT